mmetsp:Transcript_5486/g.6054  ORF Transcript_5486/g.6054 Transcript_5486/m.6054 type:complete len:227 (-) Transcript_5486:176-856(-)
MKIWPDSNNSRNSTGSAVAYSQVHLVDTKPVDLFIHSSRGKSRFWSCFSAHELWLEEGRPRDLSSLPLATWSLLTTSIKEYQRGLHELNIRIIRRFILPTYFIWFFCLMISMMYIEEGNITQGTLVSAISWYGLLIVLFASVFISKYYTQKHVDEIFHPAVKLVLEELDGQLMECGYEVRLFVQEGSYSCPTSTPTISFLRFTPLSHRDEDKDAAEAVVMISHNDV